MKYDKNNKIKTITKIESFLFGLTCSKMKTKTEKLIKTIGLIKYKKTLYKYKN